ncbi:hypothetical protein A2115_03145, partial [Candidatus Woesebacteria bacterium GWA1_41_8]
NDLVEALVRRKNEVFVLAYRPLTTKVDWKVYERRKGSEILRIPWIPGIFYNLVESPVLEFLYLFPGLFLLLPFIIIIKDPDVIHAHGLVAGFVGVCWGRLFGKRVVISTHNIYHFPDTGAYRNFVKWIFGKSDFVMGLSKQETGELSSLGIQKTRLGTFTYWIDLNKFKPISKIEAKKRVGWGEKFVSLFVGRLVSEKGIRPVLQAAESWNKNIHLAVVGFGPLEAEVKRISSNNKNVVFLGKIPNENLPVYYSAADILIIPSTHEEGFGRVILESLACGTPVIGSKRGAIPEAMDESVGQLIDVNVKNIRGAAEYFYKNPDRLMKLSKNARKFAEEKYSAANVEQIIRAYTKET